jgi:thioredoxin reductase (NADPH)
MYDIIIVGLGPAGVSAAIYAKRSNMNILGIESLMVGGLLNTIDDIKNYPGYGEIKGPNLAQEMFKQIKNLGVPFVNDTVTNIEPCDDYFIVTTTKEKYQTKKVILAIGRKARKLGLNNEDKYLGHGLSYCAICDGPFFKGKDVCVVGGGNSAVQETIYLANIVNKVYLVHRNSSFRADTDLVDKLKTLSNVELIMNDNVIDLVGEPNLNKVVLKSGKELNVAGLFTFIGYFPGTSFLSNLNICDENGYILTNENMETKLSGIYACGDIIKQDYYQIVMATSEGAIASLNAIKAIKTE